ncbi:MAG: hypothetical protein AAFV53_13870 [Myxococcota bacterium]
MSNSSHHLAMRFRAGHQRQQEAEQAANERQERSQEEAWVAQETILDDLEEFAETSGFMDISRTGHRLRLRYDGSKLTFLLDRESPIVHVEAVNLSQTCHLEYHPHRKCWQLISTDRRGRRTSADLYNHGLERLIVSTFQVRPVPSSHIRRPAASKDREEKEASKTRNSSRFFR